MHCGSGETLASGGSGGFQKIAIEEALHREAKQEHVAHVQQESSFQDPLQMHPFFQHCHIVLRGETHSAKTIRF